VAQIDTKLQLLPGSFQRSFKKMQEEAQHVENAMNNFATKIQNVNSLRPDSQQLFL
jgi:hypothetical protein